MLSILERLLARNNLCEQVESCKHFGRWDIYRLLHTHRVSPINNRDLSITIDSNIMSVLSINWLMVEILAIPLKCQDCFFHLLLQLKVFTTVLTVIDLW